MSEIFEQASRQKIRFTTPVGLLTLEDLWDLPLSSNNANKPNLNAIAVGLYNELKGEADEVSFVNPAPTGQKKALQLAFDVVKHIIDVRVAERDKAADAAKRAETKQKILEIMSKKENQELEGKSLEELKKLAEEM